jgi:hypothetical protein
VTYFLLSLAIVAVMLWFAEDILCLWFPAKHQTLKESLLRLVREPEQGEPTIVSSRRPPPETPPERTDKASRIIVFCAGITIMLCGLFPPWIYTVDLSGTSESRGSHSQKDAGYRFIATPPPPEHEGYAFGTRLDLSRLEVQWFCVLAGAASARTLVGIKRRPKWPK